MLQRGALGWSYPAGVGDNAAVLGVGSDQQVWLFESLANGGCEWQVEAYWGRTDCGCEKQGVGSGPVVCWGSAEGQCGGVGLLSDKDKVSMQHGECDDDSCLGRI